MNPLKAKLEALEKIYTVYASSMADMEIACAEKCAHCCTTDVTLTTLEAYHLWQGMDADGKDHFLRKIEMTRDVARFRPAITTNHLAEICAAGEEPPQEEKAGVDTRCPILVDDLCEEYEQRPFHCRCMVSRQVCRELGNADMGDFTLALNSVFLQVIEHIDRPGCTGNLLDLLPLMQSAGFSEGYESGNCMCSERHLVANRSLTVLMIPPEHKDRLAPVIGALQSIRL
jgi:hypothetical protein